ncbi:SseB family protein [Micromonospora sp. WMMD980]|uniref:SseB family protein n=1 Tax=Micromonospora sp. WMMD980 TaxID=3016088 RepID=UPI0024170FB7|nr:SseB family protein [Micromonospora sp. WMMD980]MDG4803441.1 SseB family protein [Micromonospora sp. WMMD980]
MTGWEPATEAEVAMRDALRAQDQQQYFRVLTQVDLVLPVAGGSTAGWGTWTSGGRTHVLAFTSVAALRASLGENAGATRRLPYADLAATWPNQEWWLAVNPGLPVEGYLPAWYVAQLARGDVRLPGRTMGARARLERVQSAARAARDGATEDPTVPVPAASPPPPPVPPARRVRVAEPDESPTVPMRTTPILGRRVPTAAPRRPEPAAGERGRAASGDGADVDALDGWLTDLRRHPDEPDPFAAAGTTPAAEKPVAPAPPPARSFFEPTSGRSGRRSSPLDAPRRPADRATPPSRFAGGQPFPRRRPLNEPVREEPTRAFGVGPEETPQSDPTEAAAPFQPARPPEDATGALPRRHAAPAPPAPDQATASRRSLDGPAEAEELPPSIAEPVSGPPAPPRRDFTPIVIEGVVIEARDLSDPVPAWSPPTTNEYATAAGPPATGSAVGGAAPWATASEPLSDLVAPVDEVTAPLSPAAGPDDVTVRLRRPAAPSAEPAASPFALATPLFESTPADEPSPAAASVGAATTSLFEPSSRVEPAVAQPSPAEPTGSLFAPASSKEPTTSLFGSGPAEESTSVFAPAAPAEPAASLFAPAAPAASSSGPGSAADSTTASFASTEESTTALFAPASPEEQTTTLLTTAEAGQVPAAANRPDDAERTDAEPVTAGAPAPTVEPDFEPANEVEEELLAAAGSGNTDGFLTTLLLARVLLPVAFDSAAGSRPGDPGFSWRTETVDGVRYVAVFTSPERLAEHAEGPVDTIRVKFVQLIRRWPDENWSFLINPGSPVGAAYPGEQVLALANWAAEVGLGDDPETEPEPPATGPAPKTRTEPDVPAARPSRPVTMQKAIAASQLAYYLERGYDRVSGFVHRAGELAHLRTPAELYDALGLGHPGSPFSRDDEELYLLRWPAYRPSLYRIPYGGQHEAAMRAMEGWVIERPPFRGNGFAPGESSDVVAEFKVDSARLPHGAELWRIGADGDARLVAVLDTDALLWRKADEA